MGQPLTVVPPFFLIPQGCLCVQLGYRATAMSAGVGQRCWHVPGHLWEHYPVLKQGLCLVLAELLPSVTHRQPPQLLEPPSSPVCDPVKLRMLQDIDDSQPHTWTSQSRSFRKLARLVGADSMEDGEDELDKKPRDAHGSSWGMVEQRQPPQPLEPPRSPGCDPGKLRMLEDAEDWQPRTGTSQSRSFRKLAQLTGTDGSEFLQGLVLAGGDELC
ncbi:uncharacterized protein LOC113942018 isoform X1 [Corapipo altera]|uniref:uncharacterized protein LOC113942018 isoform X1 n=2 Tax=Corapipo altera TaxID=415028 RepID=UPI000FD68231|nr:uncharacterized protein LOC113942018 isoform X1 [Corapipo altera]